MSNSAISLMFNSGAKMMVICFLQVMIAKIFSAYFIKLEVNPYENFSILCQIIIMCAFFAYLTKKIPDLVSSFLNGSPALSGGGMISQATGMASKAAMVAGAGVGALAGTAGAAQAASTMSGAKGLTEKMSALPKAAAQLASGIPQAGGNLLKTGAAAALTSNPLAAGFARGAKAVVGSDGSMANKSFANKVQDLAGLTDQKHDSILGNAVENATPPPPPPPPLRDSSTFSRMPSGLSGSKRPSGMNTYTANKDDYKKNSDSGGGNGNKGEDTNQANHPILNNANGGKEKETKEMSQYKENTIERPVTLPLGEKRDSATFRPAPSGFVGHKTGGSSASSVNNVFNNVNQYTTSMTDAKNSSSTYNMQGGSGKK